MEFDDVRSANQAFDGGERQPAIGVGPLRMQASFEQAPMGIIELDLGGFVLRANERLCKMLDYSEDELIGTHFMRYMKSGHGAKAQAQAALGSMLIGAHNYRIHVIRKGGMRFWSDLVISPAVDEKGERSHFIGILNDITDLKKKAAKLAFLSTHDELTGLPNRKLFMDRMKQAIAQSCRRGDVVALLCLGGDNFKLINESLGRATGDQLLASLATRLRECVRSGDTVSRHGGGKFFLILNEIADTKNVSVICEKILTALAPSHAIGEHTVFASCRIGITLYPQDGADASTLLGFANMALARTRAQGANKYQFFSAEMNQHAVERSALEAELRHAILRDELRLLYQPQADLQSGQIVSLEALLRWDHPTLGLVSANRFLPVAEEAGFNDTIGDWVLRRACHDMRGWREAGLPGVSVALNISPKQFRDGMGGKIAAVLDEFGIPAGLLSLEITEMVLRQGHNANELSIRQIKELGLGLTLDDFGAGYSSLSYLKQFPFDVVKIDCAFISELATNANDAALVKTIITMAHHMGIKVVAKRVETEAQCNFLRSNMCDQIQGHFFAPALTPDGVAQHLRDKRALPPHLLRMQKKKRSLLLVDDEKNIVSALKRLLRRDDYQIFSADSGPEGLAVLEQNQVDVIISDQRMPGMIGADFLRKAKDLYPETIRIMLSGYTELQSVTDAVNEGAIYKFLTKPWDDDLLRGHIADAFRLKEITDENVRLNLEVRTANHQLATTNRRMEHLLEKKQQRIKRDAIRLNVTQEILQFLPLPVIGVDDEGMVAFVNAAFDLLFSNCGVILGSEAALMLPQLFPARGQDDGAASQTHQAQIDGVWFSVVLAKMGANSTSRGNLITLSRCEPQPCIA